MCSGHISVRFAERTSSKIISRALDSYDLTRPSHCSMAGDNFMYFRCSKIENCGSATSVSDPPSAGQTFSRVSVKLPSLRLVWSSAQCPTLLHPEALPVQRGLLDFHGIGTCFVVVHLSIWVFPVVLPSPECLQGDVTTAAAMFSNLNAQSSMMLLWS